MQIRILLIIQLILLLLPPDNGVFEFVGAGYYGGIEWGTTNNNNTKYGI